MLRRLFKGQTSCCKNGTSIAKALSTKSATPSFFYQELFDLAPDTTTKYRKLTGDYVKTVEFDGTSFLKVDPRALQLLSAQAMTDIAHLLRYLFSNYYLKLSS